MGASDLEAEQRLDLGAKIDHSRKRKGWTLAILAEKSGYDERTIGNVIHGRPTRLKTVYEICSVLGIDIDQLSVKPPKIAGEKHGGYVLENYSEYLGQFYSVRRNFTEDDTIFRSVFDFRWSDTNHCLEFVEQQRYIDRRTKKLHDYTQSGEVFISNQMGSVHLVTIARGAVRLLTLTKLIPPDDDTMEGVVVTQSKTGAFMRPSVSPVFFTKLKSPASIDQLMGTIGPLYPHDDGYAEFVARLNEVENKTVLFAQINGDMDGPSGYTSDLNFKPIFRN
jgi:transcriptional regulator with XRE-family HTH domain